MGVNGFSTPQSSFFGSTTQQSQPAFGNSTFGLRHIYGELVDAHAGMGCCYYPSGFNKPFNKPLVDVSLVEDLRLSVVCCAFQFFMEMFGAEYGNMAKSYDLNMVGAEYGNMDGKED
ncbi:hypothetical protein Bca52824_069271 [Brassica carinata]|uniref:Uncharacterized protein n=1 Tax=Brassica carinata TaxID=52824 RepID=A0A8X7Q314_BRACI|nr:hypothetical protein Bca52824_069271 [Brassica carinata]